MQLLAVFLAVIVGYALLILAPAMSQAIASWVKNGGWIISHAFGPIANAAVQLTRWISNKIGGVIQSHVLGVVAWLGNLYGWIAHIGVAALAWPLEMYRLQTWLLFRAIPRLVKALAHGGAELARTVGIRVSAVERALVNAERFLTKYAKKIAVAAVTIAFAPWLPFLHWLRVHVHVLAHAIPKALDLPSAKDIAGLRKRIGKLERRLAPAAITALVVAALTRLGIGFLRCTNVRKVGKQVCGMNTNLLDSLLLDAVAIFSVLSVVDFANELRTVEDEALAIMGKLVREFPG